MVKWLPFARRLIAYVKGLFNIGDKHIAADRNVNIIYFCNFRNLMRIFFIKISSIHHFFFSFT